MEDREVETLVSCFQTYLRARKLDGYSEKTLHSYKLHLERLMGGGTPIDAVQLEHLRSHLTSLTHLQTSSLANKVRALYQLSNIFVVVDREVIQEDNLPWSQGRNKHLTQVGKKGFGIDCARMDQALLSVKPLRCHCGDEADFALSTSRRFIDCALTFQRAGVAA